MRYAVLSDVHANLEALTAVLTDADGEGATAVLCLGDLVGYGADPGPCVETLAGRGATLVAGNHEHGATGRQDLAWFNPAARAAIVWTRDHLRDDARRYLAALPLMTAVGDASVVHASPHLPEEWDYLMSAEDGFAVFGAFDTRLCFVGHSHRPGVWSLGSGGPEHDSAFQAWPVRIRLEDGRRYLINVGSVGQPRDRDRRAAYAIWDEDEREVTIRRVPYDHRAPAAKILAAGLPRFLAERLAGGV
ncbi:MAG TPA: metallophosphoesterase family protein [Candidatus Limnocylindrales bacterium]|nr:metallophosphoesterase family protein [Candidatus Limnocylindrales bacterium]